MSQIQRSSLPVMCSLKNRQISDGRYFVSSLGNVLVQRRDESRLMLSPAQMLLVVEVKKLNLQQSRMWRGLEKLRNWSDLLRGERGKTWWQLWSVESRWRGGV